MRERGRYRTDSRHQIAKESAAAQAKLELLERGAQYQEQRCLDKYQYATRKIAKVAIKEQPHRDLVEYRCPHCGLFHVASKWNLRRAWK